MNNIIKIYEKNETSFTHNGIKNLHPTSCTITRNLYDYTYELDMEHPIDDSNVWKEIIEGRIIKANGQYFRIFYTSTSVIDSSLTVYAKHVFFDLQNNFIEDTNIVAKNGNMSLGQLFNSTSFNHNFTSYSDISKVNNLRCVRKNVLDALLGESESFISRWGGEFDADNFNIKIVNQVGKDNGYNILYGKNLTGLKSEVDYTEIVTRIRPVGFDGIELPDDNKYVDSPNINNYAMPIIKEYKYENVKWTGSPNYQANEDDDTSTVFNDLSLAQAELRRLASLEFTENEVDLPKVSCEINFIELSHTEEYSQFKNLQKVSLGDIVTIYHKPLDINIKARCISYVYDCILDKYESITIGSYQKNFFKETASTNQKLENNDFDFTEQFQSVYAQAISKMTDMMNNAMTGYVVLSNSEILIMDSPDKNSAKNVWKFNSSGIAHSSTGYEGDYTVGMTMDGHINGALITAGSIKADMLEAGTITTRELAVEIQTTINTAMTEEKTQAMITANLNEFESNLSQTFITQENATKQIQDATEVAVQEATQNIVSESVSKAMENVNDQLDGKLSDYTTNTLNPALQNAMNTTLQDSKDYVVEVTGNYYTKQETDSKISQTRDEIELGISETYETKESTSIKIGEAIDGITVGAINRTFGTAEEKTYVFTGVNNEAFIAYNISPDISDKEVIISFEYDFNGTIENGSLLKFQAQYLSTSNAVTYAPNHNFIIGTGYEEINIKNQQVSFTDTFHALQQDAKFRFRADGITGTFTIRKAQIKVGNKVTEWSIAPEDIENNANNYTIQQLSNYYTKNQTDSLIDIAKNEINLGVSSTYETKQNVQTIVSQSIETNTNNTNTIIQNVIQDYYTKAETDSAIKIAQEEINLGVSTKYETKESVNQTIQNVNNRIDNIKVGGINLLIGTSEMKKIKGTNSLNQLSGLYKIINNDKHFCNLANEQVVLSFDYEFIDGETGFFTIQTNGVIQSSLGETKQHIVDLTDTIYNTSSVLPTTLVDENGNTIIDENGNNITSINVSSSGHIVKTTTLTDSEMAGFTGLRLCLNNCNGSLKIYNMKLEIGNTATAWSPSLEDVATDTFNQNIVDYYTKEETLSEINIAKDSITSTVSQTVTEAFRDVNIGGENLIINSGFNYDFYGWDGSFEYFTLSDGALRYNQTSLTEPVEYELYTNPIDVKDLVNQELTFSFTYKIADKSILNSDVIGFIRFFNNANLILQKSSVLYMNATYPTNYINDTRETFVATVQVPKGATHCRVGVYAYQNGNISWDNFQLEIGNIPTAWKASIQDAVIYLDGTSSIIFEEVEDLSKIVSSNIGSDIITPDMKVKLISEYQDAISVFNKLNSMYSTLNDTSFSTLPEELKKAKEDLISVISNLEGSITTTSDSGLSNVLDKFNKFYSIAEELTQAISNALTGITKETKTQVTQLADSYNITTSRIETLGNTVNELSTHFIFSTDGMTIKSTANATKSVKLDNDSLDFMDNNEIVAQVTDKQLYITNAEVTNQMKIGNIVIKPSGIGGIMFIYE